MKEKRNSRRRRSFVGKARKAEHYRRRRHKFG
jgi:hypothetical protein